MKNPLDQTFIHESIWFGRGLDLSHRVFVICIQQLCLHKICLTENIDLMDRIKNHLTEMIKKYMRIFMYWQKQVATERGKDSFFPLLNYVWERKKDLASKRGKTNCKKSWLWIWLLLRWLRLRLNSFEQKQNIKCFIEKGIIHILYTF